MEISNAKEPLDIHIGIAVVTECISSLALTKNAKSQMNKSKVVQVVHPIHLLRVVIMTKENTLRPY